ncbi:MAG TPA: hypothetical protein EYQ18_21735 [Candidatus Handelsmanbacteria bacterium]|nr:hypothetical protein [Candidatus Handelsmanbacteria bacterium]HIM30237.1 hypothetical protein [Planctomycetota bacterium]
MFAQLIRKRLESNDDGRPAGVHTEQTSRSLIIRYRNTNFSRYSGLPAALFMSSVFAVFVWGLVFGDLRFIVADADDHSGLLQSIDYKAAMIFLLISAFMLWTTHRSAVRLCNTITFTVCPDGDTSVVSAPIPTFDSITVETASIAQLFCTEQIKGREGSARHGVGGTSEAPLRAYAVRAELASSEEIRLARGLGSFAAASFVCKEIESYLKLEDRSVAGEVRRASRQRSFGE